MEMPKTQEDLEQLIKDEVEESTVLEYKAAGSLDKRDPNRKTEVTKDVSALANSAGGIIIYGIREHPKQKYKPGSLDGISRADVSKEWLEQVISNVRPKLTVRIEPIALDTGPDHVAYVVQVPQSDTAHQATDLLYYRRFNFQAVAMQDYEIRDVMGRAKTAEFEIQTTITQHPFGDPVEQIEYKIFFRVKNIGKITGYDIMTLVLNAPVGSFNCEPELWEFKRESPGITLLSKFPIHPTMGQDLANWSAGFGFLSGTQKAFIDGRTRDVSRVVASYNANHFSMSVTMFAKDQPPATAQIEYANTEIEDRMPKSFLCKPAM